MRLKYIYIHKRLRHKLWERSFLQKVIINVRKILVVSFLIIFWQNKRKGNFGYKWDEISYWHRRCFYMLPVKQWVPLSWHPLCEFEQMLSFSSEIMGVQYKNSLSIVSILSPGSRRPFFNLPWQSCPFLPHKLTGNTEDKAPSLCHHMTPWSSYTWQSHFLLSLILPCSGRSQFWFQ